MTITASVSPRRGVDNLVDLFAVVGGSGSGLLDAADILNRQVSGTFINHWDKAIQIHEANHPEHRHFAEDLFLLDPASVFPAGTFCSLLWVGRYLLRHLFQQDSHPLRGRRVRRRRSRVLLIPYSPV
jgi:site-specific DNA-cytosine methylase